MLGKYNPPVPPVRILLSAAEVIEEMISVSNDGHPGTQPAGRRFGFIDDEFRPFIPVDIYDH